MKKKMTSVGLIVSMLLGLSAQAGALDVTNEGYIDITGEGAAAGSVVTVEIIDGHTNLSNEGVWSSFSDNGEKTLFMGTTNADDDGKYELGVFLTDSGSYIVRVGNDNFDAVKEDALNFINEEKMKNSIDALKAAVDGEDIDAVREVLENNRFDLGVFSNVGYDADMEKTAEILYLYIKSNLDLITEDTMAVIIEKACILSILSSDSFAGFEKYSDGFGISDLKVSEFYKDTYAQEFTKMMKSDNPKTIEEYNDALEKNILISLVKLNDSSEDLMKCMKMYAGKIGIDETNITSDMCKALMGAGNINSYSDIKNFVQSYLSKNNNQTGGSGSTGTGSYSGKTSSSSSGVGNMTYSQEYIPASSQTSVEIFSDMEGYGWAKGSVEGLFKKGIVSGRDGGRFEPGDNVKREEIVKMLVKLFELSVIGSKLPFLDVAEDEWYTEFVECAYHSGIINGYSDTIFGIGDRVSREDLAVMIVRAAQACDYTFKSTAQTQFADEADIAEYAKDAVKILSDAGIIDGDENARFNPKQKATRAESAKILWTTIQNCTK
ncbi:MAG: S-layer homology domain-containing protein [Clostridiales bacterium]|nr:S-layer homology domain-containing protein [Clostridiales bacterium]